MKRDILVPFDGSKHALAALRVALTLAKSLNEKIIVLNVQPELQTPNVKRFFNEQAISDYQRQMFSETVEPIKPELNAAGVNYEIRLKIGDPKEVILKQAYPFASDKPHCSDVGVRMIIMGSRGMHPILGGFLGSVSYGVVNAAPCPVTIVPYACGE